MPPLYEFRIRSRVFRWYDQLRSIEERATDPAQAMPALLEELRQLAVRVEKINVPLSYADELYALRNHIEGVRQRLAKD